MYFSIIYVLQDPTTVPRMFQPVILERPPVTDLRSLMHRSRVTDPARVLDERAVRPIRGSLGPRRHVIGSVASHLRYRSVVRSGGDA
jgi:hypothetical protein